MPRIIDFPRKTFLDDDDTFIIDNTTSTNSFKASDLKQYVSGSTDALEKRVENLEYAAAGINYREELNSSVSLNKPVPDKSLPNALVNKVGVRTLFLNQLMQNHNFSDGTNNWLYSGGTFSVAGTGNATLTKTGSVIAKIYQNGSTYFNRVYNIIASVKAAIGTVIRVSAGSDYYDYVCTSGSAFETINAKIKANVSGSGFSLGIFSGTSATIQYVQVFDLTTMFGPGYEYDYSVTTIYTDHTAKTYDSGTLTNYTATTITTQNSTIDLSGILEDVFPDGMFGTATVFDYIDLEEKKAYKYFKKVSNGSSTTWSFQNTANHKYGYRVIDPSAQSYDNINSCISTLYPSIGFTNANHSGETLCCTVDSSGGVQLRVRNAAMQSMTTAAQVQSHLRGFEFDVYYAVKEPQIIDISQYISDNGVNLEGSGAIEATQGITGSTSPFPWEVSFLIKISAGEQSDLPIWNGGEY